MKNDSNSKIIGVRNGITYRVDTSPENNTPEKIRQRLSTICYIALSILASEGKLQDGQRADQLRRIWEERNPWARYRNHSSDTTEDPRLAEPVIQEIRVRLPTKIVSQIDERARRLQVSRSGLVKRWIMEACRQIE